MQKSAKEELLERVRLMDEQSAALVLLFAKRIARPQSVLPPPTRAKRQSAVQERMASLRAQVKKNPERWTVDSMAEAFHLTRSRFSVLYKKTFGVPPDKEKRDFLNQKALSLLLKSDKSVQDIALECGYNECENFIRAFRKNNGMSPLQFRQMANKKAPPNGGA